MLNEKRNLRQCILVRNTETTKSHYARLCNLESHQVFHGGQEDFK